MCVNSKIYDFWKLTEEKGLKLSKQYKYKQAELKSQNHLGWKTLKIIELNC